MGSCTVCGRANGTLNYPGGDATRAICDDCRRDQLRAAAAAVPHSERWRNSKAQRAALKEKFGGRCAYCGETLGDRWHADHLESVTRIGDRVFLDPEMNRVSNMMPSCAPCNLHKSSYTLEQWREMLTRSADILRRDTSTFRAAERFGVVAVNTGPVSFHFEQTAQPQPGSE